MRTKKKRKELRGETDYSKRRRFGKNIKVPRKMQDGYRQAAQRHSLRMCPKCGAKLTFWFQPK
jgi:hypothetical protein